jgi:hypothetical protein
MTVSHFNVFYSPDEVLDLPPQGTSTNLRHRSFILHRPECRAYFRRGKSANALSTTKLT